MCVCVLIHLGPHTRGSSLRFDKHINWQYSPHLKLSSGVCVCVCRCSAREAEPAFPAFSSRFCPFPPLFFPFLNSSGGPAEAGARI